MLVNVGYLLPDYVRSEQGFQDVVLPADPAAGSVFARRTPGSHWEIPISLRCTFTTTATVATRQLFLSFVNQDGRFLDDSFAIISQAASNTYGYRWTTSVTNAYNTPTNLATMPMVAAVLSSGWFIQVSVQNLQVGDQMSSISLVLQRYPTGGREEVPQTRLLSVGGYSGTTTPFPSGGGGASAPAGGGAAAPSDGGAAAPAEPATVQVAAPQYSGAPPGLAPGTKVM